MRVFLSYGVHLFTVSGVFFSFLALIASIERNLPLVFFYLALALFIDGVDGSLARRADVKKYTPNINGENLDNIIDYLNYVFLPAFVIYWLDLVPEGMALISVATILIVSCYTFANNSIKTSDLYFSGFPALWNVVILYFYILDTDPFTNLLVIFALSFLTFIPFIGRIGPEKFGDLRKKVADEIHTTFESKYSNIISLEGALSRESIISYTKQATGEKYLIKPNL